MRAGFAHDPTEWPVTSTPRSLGRPSRRGLARTCRGQAQMLQNRPGRSSCCTALSRALRREVDVPHRHFDGGVAHQLLDDLEWDTPQGEVAAVGVAQVVPGDAPLLAAEARPAHRP